MMKELIGNFKMKNYYLAEIDHAGDKLKSWSWDIYIAANDKKEYKGKALAPGKGIEIPWTSLGGQNVLEEMMSLCEQKMPNHS